MPLERPTTELAAANLALSLIKNTVAIASFDEPDRAAARECRKWFAATRAELLRRYDWNFASRWVRPAADPVSSISPLKTRFIMPADCLKVRAVQDATTDEWAVGNEIVDASGVQVPRIVLLTNLAAPLVRYTTDETNVALWDAQFLTAFAAELAENIAPGLGRSVQTARAVAMKAEIKTDAAAASDAREEAPKQITKMVPAIRARFAGRLRG